MSLTRAWYVYNQTLPGGKYNSSNYFYVSFFPACQTTGNQICSVYGIYDDGNNPPYGDHPKPFSAQLQFYINQAVALNTCYPFFPGDKPYAYVKVV